MFSLTAKLKSRMSNNQWPTANFQLTFGLSARYLEIGSWKLDIGYSVPELLPIKPSPPLSPVPNDRPP